MFISQFTNEYACEKTEHTITAGSDWSNTVARQDKQGLCHHSFAAN